MRAFIPRPMEIPLKFGFDLPKLKMFKNNDHMHVYSPRAGADNAMGS